MRQLDFYGVKIRTPDDPLTWNSKPRAEMQMKELVGTGMVEAYNHQTLRSNRQSKKFMMLLCKYLGHT